MSFAAGALYLAQNNDSNEYRIPRVWHWLAAGQWHWIRTLDFRMNVAGCNFEWLLAPLMLFTRHDRFLFWGNWISFLLLPGLFFSVFTRLKVRPRVAWWWAWLLPSGWCFVLQAGSEMNDSFAAIYALASVDFALRARENQSARNLWFSILAAGLLTGAKQTDLPLLLPWLIAVFPSLHLLRKRAAAAIGVLLLAALVSFLPLSFFNFRHTGNWMGTPTPGMMHAYWKLESPSCFWGFIGNVFCLPMQNLVPPVFPFSHRWNDEMHLFLQTPFGSHFRTFENFCRLGRSVNEGNAGIGLLVSILAMVSVIAARRFQPDRRPFRMDLLVLVRWSGIFALFVFMCKAATFQNARQCAAYYAFLFPVFLVSEGQALLVRKQWWQKLVLAAMLATAGMLVVSRNRPLFPAVTIMTRVAQQHRNWHWAERVRESYAYRLSHDLQQRLFKSVLPAQEHVIGYATVRSSDEPGQWVPFGSRRVERVLPDDTAAELQARGIHFVLVDSDGMGLLGMSIGDWTNRFDGTLVDSKELESGPGETVGEYLVRLNALPKK